MLTSIEVEETVSTGRVGTTVIEQIYKCNICKTVRKETNHWFDVVDDYQNKKLEIWEFQGYTDPAIKHVCGHNCLQKVVESWVSKNGKLA